MNFLRTKKMILVIALLLTAAAITVFLLPKTKIDFNTQVKPIFNKKCITCHGGVKQKAGFSLLFREEALGNTKSGKPAIIPGNPDHDRRIISERTEPNVRSRLNLSLSLGFQPRWPEFFRSFVRSFSLLAGRHGDTKHATKSYDVGSRA